jgi:hypothetical protein
VRIHLAAKHALEFELAYLRLDLRQLTLDFASSILVILALGELKEFDRVAYRAAGGIDAAKFRSETRSLLAKLLRLVGLLPDGRIFELATYFFETFFLEIVFKETPLRS